MKTVIAMTALALASAATLVAAAPEGKDRAAHHERLRAADTNGDGLISRAEAAALPRIAQHFDQIDTNKDGQISVEEMRAFHAAHAKHRGEHVFKNLDKNGDGKISREEAAAAPRLAAHFDAIDTNKDGFITHEEMKAARQAQHAAKAGK